MNKKDTSNMFYSNSTTNPEIPEEYETRFKVSDWMENLTEVNALLREAEKVIPFEVGCESEEYDRYVRLANEMTEHAMLREDVDTHIDYVLGRYLKAFLHLKRLELNI